jgi:prepilin-type processing-associated H-X9-DG protein
MTVIGVIGLLIGLLLPAIQRAREAASRASCLSNMRQIGLALQNHHNDHGRFPPRPMKFRTGADANAYLGWMALILPYLEQDSLFTTSEHACRADPDPLHNPPHVGLATVIRLYCCPSDGRLLTPLTDRLGVRAAFTSYIGIAGTAPPGAAIGHSGVLGGMPGCRIADITDGTSNTIMVGERPPPDSLQAGWWYPGHHWDAVRGPNNGLVLGERQPQPSGGDGCISLKATFGPGRTDNPCDRFHLWSLHMGGANFLFADGSARYFSYSAEPLMFALGSRDGGEKVEIPD